MTTYNVPDMNCGHCRATIEKAILALDPQAQVTFDMAARKVSVQGSAEPSLVRAALEKAGYASQPAVAP